MKYRILGRTGLRVSVISLGGHEYRRWLPGNRDIEHFVRTQPERNKLVGRAMDAGINYFDTTFLEEAESLGQALKTLGIRRDDIYIPPWSSVSSKSWLKTTPPLGKKSSRTEWKSA